MDSHKPKAHPVRVLLPHEVLDALASHPYAFGSLMLGNLAEKERVSFWEHMKRIRPDHPAHSLDYSRLIPLCIHGDGCQMFREDECFVYSMSSLWGSLGVLQDCLLYQFPVIVIHERHMRSEAAAHLFAGLSPFN